MSGLFLWLKSGFDHCSIYYKKSYFLLEKQILSLCLCKPSLIHKNSGEVQINPF